jgi:CheY-like chemotaxis protein
MKREPQLCVLVAEDHPVNRMLLGLLLTNLGVQSYMVENGKQAVEAAKPNSYSLILMDIMMPEMDGFEAAFEIRKREFELERHTPIIAVTAMDKDNVKEQAIRSGMDDYVAKPISREILQAKIERWSQIQLNPQPVTPEMEMKVRNLTGQNEEMPINNYALKMLYGLEQLDDILALFLTVTETLLAQLESAIHHQDVAIVGRLAHEIKGSSYAVSAKEMVKLCRELEHQGEQENWPEAARTYAALGLAFARVRQFLGEKQRLLKGIENKVS